MAQIQHEWEQKTRDAHDAGVREGEAAGRSRAAAELQPVVERLARAMDELANLRGRLRSEAEGDLIKLALAIASMVTLPKVSVVLGKRKMSADA
jgi:flagellar biosynthesis/type III secretory pathway protein FliH